MLKLFLIITILFSAIGVFAQSDALTNADIIEMTKSGLSPEIVLRKIRTSNTKFDVSAAGLIGLKKANLTDDVITAMIDRQELLPPNANRAAFPHIQRAERHRTLLLPLRKLQIQKKTFSQRQKQSLLKNLRYSHRVRPLKKRC